jgi:hypothetical protein
MNSLTSRVRSTLAHLWSASRPLTAVGLLMAADALGSAVGLVLDSRTIGGAPAWLKPLKFGVSTAIYSLTLAWVFSYLPDWPRTRRIVERVTAAVFVMEIAIINLQAWRGTTSHFNVSTPLNGVLFTVMGLGIVIQTATSLTVAVALWRQPIADRVMALALRLGMSVTIVGALTGGLMTRPTAAQLAEARAGHGLPVAGAHTVGAPDGGPGLPGTGWSRDHGDLRVPHFVGLHALQVLALIAVFVRRRRLEASRAVRVMAAAAASYVALFAVLMWQALRGQAVARPDAAMAAVLSVWLISTGLAVWALTRHASDRLGFGRHVGVSL